MYPDTETGARRLLDDKRTWLDGENVSEATFEPDPSNPGCWLAAFPSERRILVYVDSHPRGPSTEELGG